MLPSPGRLRREISSPQLILRQLLPANADVLYEAVHESRAQLQPWLTWVYPAYYPGDTARFLESQPPRWESGEEYSLGIYDSQSNRLLGGIGLNLVEAAQRRANLGYWVRTSAARHGIASAAVQLLAPAALEDLGFARLEIVVAVDNLSSQRVAERSGAHREGIARQRLHMHLGQSDAVVYSFIRADFQLPPLID